MEECPTENEVGIRTQPVCVDGVDTEQFNIINSSDAADVPEVTRAVAVSRLHACRVTVIMFFVCFET